MAESLMSFKATIESILGGKYQKELDERKDNSKLLISVKDYPSRDNTQEAVVVRITYSNQPPVDCTIHIVKRGDRELLLFINNFNHHVIFNNYGVETLTKAIPYIDSYFWKSFQRMIANNSENN